MQRHLLKIRLSGLTAALLLTFTAPAGAVAVITDPVNDFIPSYTGRHRPDLDVVSVFATFDGVAFHIGATMAGPIDTSPAAGLLYVYGINRGNGANSFTSLGLPGVVFDSVVTMTGLGVTGGNVALPAGSAHISGASFQIDIPLSSLPSLSGFTPLQYGFNLWPRDAQVAPGNAQISDFAPNATTFTADLPEPLSLSLFVSALLGLGFVRRRAPR